ncbi:hypothetical protein PCANB_001816 [Pneumocystis canis]|nr:hypothetical protein PCK1_002033 [Pneumocystis canis]KAG5440246.1 hypothetical protein PCANB_001816 [Pneumocystis canis]
MLSKQWIKAGFWSSTIVAAGYALMIYTRPNEEELYHNFSPALKSMYDKNVKEMYTQETIKYIKNNRNFN